MKREEILRDLKKLGEVSLVARDGERPWHTVSVTSRVTLVGDGISIVPLKTRISLFDEQVVITAEHEGYTLTAVYRFDFIASDSEAIEFDAKGLDITVFFGGAK